MKIEKRQQEPKMKKEDILGYGGHSIVYKQKYNNTCLKVYRDKLSDTYRSAIKLNYIDLTKIHSLRNNPQFLTPLSISTNQYGTLQSVELPFLPCPNMWHIKRQCYMTDKYLQVALSMIKIIKELTNKGIVITDLKLANMLVDDNNKVIVIDNDFSIRTKNSETLNTIIEGSKSVYITNYREKFSSSLDENYNKYMLINMMGLLLVEEDKLEKAWPVSSKPTWETLKNINRIIQTDRSISQQFKRNFQNNLSANMEINASQNVIDDYTEVVLRKIRNNKRR